ncbi:MAG: ParA family protein [Candidatus Nanopelagicales bacterium]|nr:ParA family protein [Candidatus Nanopelagicales bacterium]
MVDLDPQGNLAEELGYVGTATDDAGEKLATAMQFGRPATPVSLRDGLDVLPGGEYLDDLQSVLSTRSDGSSRRTDAHGALADSLAPIAGEYDLVVLDCPPGSPVLQTAALGAARWLVIPTRTDDSSRKGLLNVARRYMAARERGAPVELLGVCLFGVTTSAKKVRADARHDLERDLWYERLRNPGAAVEVVPGSAASLASDYAHLAEEILRTLQERESVDLRDDSPVGAPA